MYYCCLEMFFGHYGKSKKMVELKERGKGSLYVAYRDSKMLSQLGEDTQKRFSGLYGHETGTFEELMATDIAAKLGAVYGISEAQEQDYSHCFLQTWHDRAVWDRHTPYN